MTTAVTAAARSLTVGQRISDGDAEPRATVAHSNRERLNLHVIVSSQRGGCRMGRGDFQQVASSGRAPIPKKKSPPTLFQPPVTAVAQLSDSGEVSEGREEP